jgi:hypothetical protein
MPEIIGIFAIIGGIIAAIAYYTESNKKSQRYYQARADVMQIVEIIEKYHETYGEYLVVERNTDEQPGSILMEILAAVHTPSGHPFYPEVVEYNPKMVNFAEAIMGHCTINGIIVDPWGEPYHIAIDTNGDGIVELV